MHSRARSSNILEKLFAHGQGQATGEVDARPSDAAFAAHPALTAGDVGRVVQWAGSELALRDRKVKCGECEAGTEGVSVNNSLDTGLAAGARCRNAARRGAQVARRCDDGCGHGGRPPQARAGRTSHHPLEPPGGLSAFANKAAMPALRHRGIPVPCTGSSNLRHALSRLPAADGTRMAIAMLRVQEALTRKDVELREKCKLVNQLSAGITEITQQGILAAKQAQHHRTESEALLSLFASSDASARLEARFLPKFTPVQPHRVLQVSFGASCSRLGIPIERGSNGCCPHSSGPYFAHKI